MLKVKHERDCDCVVAGFRWHKKGERTMVGSLLLGLFDDAGALQHVGVCASFSDGEAKGAGASFSSPIEKMRSMNHPWRDWAEHAAENDEGTKRMPGGQSRWSQGKDLSWEPLRPELGCRSCLRAHAGQSLPPHGAIPQMANGQEAQRLYLRPAGSCSSAGTGGDFSAGGRVNVGLLV